MVIKYRHTDERTISRLGVCFEVLRYSWLRVVKCEVVRLCTHLTGASCILLVNTQPTKIAGLTSAPNQQLRITHSREFPVSSPATSQPCRKQGNSCWQQAKLVFRVAPRLTENRVPGGWYPEPSAPELPRSNSQSRGYLYPGNPLIVLYGAPEPKTGVYIDFNHTLCR